MNPVARAILEAGALVVKSKPVFTWASGILSPIYCDLRLLIGLPRARETIVRALIRRIRGLKKRPQVIAGTATAGIPWAAWVADAMGLPMVYVRTKAKLHGAARQIEGGSVRGRKVVLIEDMVTTGGSSLAAVEALRREDGKVVQVISILSYGTGTAAQTFAEEAVTFHSLLAVSSLLEAARRAKRLSPKAATAALSFIATL